MMSKQDKINKIQELKSDLIKFDFDELDNAETDFFNNDRFLLTITHKGLDMYIDLLNSCMEQVEYGTDIKECETCGERIIIGYGYEEVNQYYCSEECVLKDMSETKFKELKDSRKMYYYKFG